MEQTILPDFAGKKYHILFDCCVNFPDRNWHKYPMLFITLRGQSEIALPRFL